MSLTWLDLVDQFIVQLLKKPLKVYYHEAHCDQWKHTCHLHHRSMLAGWMMLWKRAFKWRAFRILIFPFHPSFLQWLLTDSCPALRKPALLCWRFSSVQLLISPPRYFNSSLAVSCCSSSSCITLVEFCVQKCIKTSDSNMH